MDRDRADDNLRDVIAARGEGVFFPRVRYELVWPPGPPHIPLATRSHNVCGQAAKPGARAVLVRPGSEAPPGHTAFRVGDRVKVLLPVEALKLMQIIAEGGRNEKLAEHIGQVGVIFRFTCGGDARVTYGRPDDGKRFTVNPAALTRADAIEVGDVVRVNCDAAKVKRWQRDHGGWAEYMTSALGKLGTVQGIYPDGDVEVRVGNHSWTLNPLCVSVTNHWSVSAGEAVVASHASVAAVRASGVAAANDGDI